MDRGGEKQEISEFVRESLAQFVQERNGSGIGEGGGTKSQVRGREK